MKDIIKKDFLFPDYIVLILSKQLKKEINDYICFEEIVESKENEMNMISSISGTISNKYDDNDNEIVVVENDFIEKRKTIFNSYNTLYEKTKVELQEDIEKYKIILGKEVNLNINYSKYIFNESLFFEKYVQELLELLDVMNTSLKKEVKININSKDLTSIDALTKYIGSYPNIKITYNVKNKENNYNVFELYNIYLILKSKKYLTYKYISIIHQKEKYVVKVKLYSRIKDLLKFLEIDNSNICVMDMEEKVIVPIMGIIDKNISSIIIE